MNVFSSLGSAWDAFWNSRRSWTMMGGARMTTSKEVVSEDSALNYSAVWCATRLLCGTGASFPLPLYRGLDSDVREKDRKHPAFRLLNRSPNPEQTAYNFRSVMWQWQVNWGNAYAEIVREGNNPGGRLLELWPLHPERVEVCRDDDGLLYYKVHPERASGEPVELDPWQMLHIPSIITSDGIIGHGVIAHARESIGAGMAAEKYGANTFGGGGMPQVVIEHEQKWDETQRKNFRKDWEELHSGADGSRMALLQGGAKAKVLSFNAQDMQFIDSRQFSVEEIARWYGVPPHLLQHLLRATFSNIEHLAIDFVRYCLTHWLQAWDQSCWHKLLTPEEQEDYFFEHNVDGLLRGDSASRATLYQMMLNAAVYCRNDVRRLENLPPIEGGDVFLVQGATVPLGPDGKPVSSFVEGNAPATTPPSDTTDDTDNASAVVVSHLERIISHDMSRFLTKETKAMANFAKKPGEFVRLVDDFYADHAVSVRDEVTETFGALEACGVEVSAEMFVSDWIREGKSLVLEAAGNALPSELPTAIQRVFQSKTWLERPVRALEGVGNASLGV